MLKKCLAPYFALALALSACTTTPMSTTLPILTPNTALWFQVEQLDEQQNVLQTSILSVQSETATRSRWLQTDVFGVPQARLILSESGWQRDGFAPPNALSQQLFHAMHTQLARAPFRQPELFQWQKNVWRVQSIESPESE